MEGHDRLYPLHIRDRTHEVLDFRVLHAGVRIGGRHIRVKAPHQIQKYGGVLAPGEGDKDLAAVVFAFSKRIRRNETKRS